MRSQRFHVPAVCWELDRLVPAGSGRNAPAVGEQHILLEGMVVDMVVDIHIHRPGHRKSHAFHQTMGGLRWSGPKLGVVPATARVSLGL
jgi:hypothetical protein